MAGRFRGSPSASSQRFRPAQVPTTARSGRTVKWREAFLPYFTTSLSNKCGTQAVNGLIELHRSAARGFLQPPQLPATPATDPMARISSLWQEQLCGRIPSTGACQLRGGHVWKCAGDESAKRTQKDREFGGCRMPDGCVAWCFANLGRGGQRRHFSPCGSTVVCQDCS